MKAAEDETGSRESGEGAVRWANPVGISPRERGGWEVVAVMGAFGLPKATPPFARGPMFPRTHSENSVKKREQLCNLYPSSQRREERLCTLEIFT